MPYSRRFLNSWQGALHTTSAKRSKPIILNSTPRHEQPKLDTALASPPRLPIVMAIIQLCNVLAERGLDRQTPAPPSSRHWRNARQTANGYGIRYHQCMPPRTCARSSCPIFLYLPRRATLRREPLQPHRPGEPEVRELDGGVIIIAHKEQVLRLEVTVGHVYVVTVLDSVEQHHQYVAVFRGLFGAGGGGGGTERGHGSACLASPFGRVRERKGTHKGFRVFAPSRGRYHGTSYIPCLAERLPCTSKLSSLLTDSPKNGLPPRMSLTYSYKHAWAFLS